MQNNVNVYEWDDLKPATLYAFTFEFKQLHLDSINILQRLDVQVETGIWIFSLLLINIFIIHFVDNLAVALFYQEVIQPSINHCKLLINELA